VFVEQWNKEIITICSITVSIKMYSSLYLFETGSYTHNSFRVGQINIITIQIKFTHATFKTLGNLKDLWVKHSINRYVCNVLLYEVTQFSHHIILNRDFIIQISSYNVLHKLLTTFSATPNLGSNPPTYIGAITSIFLVIVLDNGVWSSTVIVILLKSFSSFIC